MAAILFGSISTLADTSELQRDAFNRAFAEHGLGWTWEREEYRSLLGSNGGAARIADYAAGRGETVDAAAVHATKSKIFQESLATSGVAPRAGVADVIAAAQEGDIRLGLVTTTSHANIAALLEALGLAAGTFAVVVDAEGVDEPKPDPAAYSFALAALDELPADCVAIEDNVGGVRSAVDAGLVCVAFPNANTAGSDFAGASTTVDQLDPAALLAVVGA